MKTFFLSFWIFAAFFASPSYSCSSFLLEGCQQNYFGKSYDWDQTHGYVLINPRNLAKQALSLNPADKPARWVSKYGSLSFNQHGRELSLGGINEKGLTIEIMWLDTSVYPNVDATPMVGEAQWIQYQLDNSATVVEAIGNAKKLRVNPIIAKVHYLVCDRTADCATFEYIDGKLVIHQDLKIKALTNHSYDDSMKFLAKHKGFGGNLPLPLDMSSLSRFTRAANATQTYSACSTSENSVEYAFESLANVGMLHTQFNIVYEMGESRVHFRTMTAPEIKTVDLNAFDFSCKNPDNLQWYDMNAPFTGNVTDQFRPYTVAQNLTLVELGFQKFANELPKALIPKVGNYPWAFKCME